MRTRTLSELYTLVLEYLTANRPFQGICSVICTLRYRNSITVSEELFLAAHFKTVPRPPDAYVSFPWYWDMPNTDRRIEFIKEIIKMLEDE